MKYYRLLRNNKETGPFSAEDLIKTGFKAYDLIWEEGKSAAWRYPSELPEFKPYTPVVEEQPFDRFYKKNAPSIQTKMPENNVSVKVINEPVRNDKPRIRVKAESRKIEITVPAPPLNFNESFKAVPDLPRPQTLSNPAPEFKKSNSPEWEKMWLDWEQEKKTVGSLKLDDDKAPEVETKFSQSLDDLKELYIEKVLKGKQPSFSFDKYKNQIAIIVISACILILGIWMGVNWSNNDETKQHMQQVVQSKPGEAKEFAGDENENIAAKNEVSDVQSAKVITVPAVESNNVSKQKGSQLKKINPVTSRNASQRVVSSKVNQSKTVLSAAGAMTKPQNKVKTLSNPAEKKDEIPSIKMAVAREKSIDNYISINSSSNAGATGVSYKVENISDITVELVMIDLQYYDASGRFKKGETIYLRNINPGERVAVKAPDDASASKITPKISMISSEQKNLYLIAD